ncbi:hypothetical protein HDU98_006696 [Podochytrium sp. JEL0797]|nr:hypothetical protein HDU98_006696 [Podochytrium sp. JEL0797]
MRLPPAFCTASPPFGPHSDETIYSYVSELTQFLATHHWLASIHAYDISTHDFFQQTFPADWRTLADPETFDVDHFVELVKEGVVRDEWPDSFKTFVARCAELKLPRDVDLREFGECMEGCEVPVTLADTKAARMSQKKLYEVERFSNLILDRIAKSPFKDSATVIDVGAGQGYLTHRLATQHPCVAVDFDSIQTVGSKARGVDLSRGRFRDARKEAKWKGKPPVRKEIVYKTARICQDTLTELVRDLETDGECTGKDLVLVGLHACGDLSATAMLNTFRDCEAVKMVAVVPCCFNLLTEARSVEDLDAGFPMSKTVRSLCNSHNLVLGHTARNLACLNFDSFSPASVRSSLYNHYKRALLGGLLSHFHLDTETLEPTRGPSMFDSLPKGEAELCSSSIERKFHKFRLNNVSQQAQKGPFVPYALEAVEVLGLKGQLFESQVVEFTRLSRYCNAEREIAVVHCVRSLLSRVLESLLLMDRFVALQEMNGEGNERVRFGMLNLFDLAESPRNMVFIAEREK